MLSDLLFMIGVVDDYTVDYNAKTFELHLTKKDDETYKRYLYTYISTYYSEVRAKEEMRGLETYQGATIIQKCLYFLIDFVYREIVKKRREAINAMKAACYEGLSENGNATLKEFIDVYFHSKYAHDEYLPKETQHGKIFNFEIVWKYMELMGEDKTGSQIDNFKHLRGACLRLLIDNPDNACFLLLKAFALFILAPKNERFMKEATESLIKGFFILQKTFRLSDQEWLANLARYQKQVLKYTDNPTIHNIIEEMAFWLPLKKHANWLEQFNDRFLKDYATNNSR